MTEKTSFATVPTELDFPKYEQQILDFWREKGIFEASVAEGAQRAKSFVFYEGPPTANGLPHNGHVLTRVVKDLFPRYRSMQGYGVLRKGGWDTHGLPVEVEVEKELRIHGKAAIEEYGVRPFVERCIESVFRYTSEWERLTERLGYWVSLEDAYVTYHRSYVESVWWALSELFNKGLLYQGHKVVWWWAQGGTALSSGEVGLGYKTVDDPSVYVACPLVEDAETALVVWTTTPWTLPSNSYIAVKPNCRYAVVELGDALEGSEKKGEHAEKKGEHAQHAQGGEKQHAEKKGEHAEKKGDKNAPAGHGHTAREAHAPRELAVKRLIVASELRGALEQKLGRKLEVKSEVLGSELAGKRYRPPFEFYYREVAEKQVALKSGGQEFAYFRVIAADFVTLDTGTGMVHIAPAFGEDDHEAHRRELGRYAAPDEVELLCAVLPDGNFKAGFGKFSGRWVKEVDRDAIRELAERKLLVHEEVYRHEYPFCWRSDQDPLIQLARPAWFIRTTARLEGAMANNQTVNWVPEHIKDGRYGDFLRNNVDWALSRERYWGTPLNVWVCSRDAEHKHAPSSVAEIEERNPKAFAHFAAARADNPKLNPHLMVHKPWIDEVTFPCPHCGAEMKRVSEVIDCWFDSGCMPFAQWGFPHEKGSKEQFDRAFPADFISEAIDQTRGWFNSLLWIASLVFDKETQERVGLSQVREFPLPFRNCIVLGHVCDREGKKESKSKGNYTPPEIILDRVSMDFAVLESAPGVEPRVGSLLVAREDLEGMDLEDGATVSVYRPGTAGTAGTVRSLKLVAHKKLPRRVALLTPEDRVFLGVEAAPNGLGTMPVEVPRLSAATRVTVEDTSKPAPGADAFRWFFYSSSPPWSNTRHSLSNVRLAQKDFLIKLRNVYSFFTIYANIDGWSPTDANHRGRPARERNLLDRWMLGELALAVDTVQRSLDTYMPYEAAACLIDLAESLSNWYVRRSRARFWGPGLEADKCDAYATLYEVLCTLSRLIAPFTPFFAEELYHNLVVRAGVPGAPASVHLDKFPVADLSLVDQRLSMDTRVVREIISIGLRVRTTSRLKVRQPLSRADVVFADGALQERMQSYAKLIQEELNVHEVRFLQGREESAVAFRLKPNFRALGPRLGKDVQAVKKALETADGARLYAELAEKQVARLQVNGNVLEFNPSELEVVVEAAPGFAAESGKVGVVVLHTVLTDELVDEGILREIMSRVQAARKDAGLGFTDRIALTVDGSERVVRVARAGEAEIRKECLATDVRFEAAPPGAESHDLGGEQLQLSLDKAPN